MARGYKEILEKANVIIHAINKKGYTSYLRGATVRNIILKKDIEEVEIITNMPFEDIIPFFYGYESYKINDNSIAVMYDGTPFIIDRSIVKDNSGSYRETDDFSECLSNEYFSIDTLFMDENSNIIDYYGVYKDIVKGRISFFNKTKKEIKIKPEKMLEVIALSSLLDFKLSKKTLRMIHRCNNSVTLIESSKKLSYLKKILTSENIKRTCNYLVKTKIIDNYLLVKDEILSLRRGKNHNISFDTIVIKALVRKKVLDFNNKNIKDLLDLTDSEVSKKIISLAIKYPKSDFSKLDLYNNGLEICLKSNNINNLLGNTNKKNRKIEKEYEDLIIKKDEEIKYFGDKILQDYKNISLESLESLLEKIKDKILNNELLNEELEIQEFVYNYIVSSEKKEVKEIEKKEETLFKIENIDSTKLIDSEEEALLKALEKEAIDLANLVVRSLDVYQEEKEKVIEELKEDYKKILIKNTSKYARLK